MTKQEVEKLAKGTIVEVDMGHKFSHSRYKARFNRIEEVPGIGGMITLCVVVPEEITEANCDWADLCLWDNMGIEPEQIIRTL